MTDGDALLAAILDAPEDDTARLVYTDWLEENNQGERAEFIRCQVAAANGTELPSMKLWDLLHHADGWFPEACKAIGVQERHHWGVMHDGTVHYEHKLAVGEVFVRRGFVSEIRLPLAAWDEHAAAIWSRHPVQRVVLTDVEPFYEDHYGSPMNGPFPAAEFRTWHLPSEVWYLDGLDGNFDSREDALESLSWRCCVVGRDLAKKLLPLPL